MTDALSDEARAIASGRCLFVHGARPDLCPWCDTTTDRIIAFAQSIRDQALAEGLHAMRVHAEAALSRAHGHVVAAMGEDVRAVTYADAIYAIRSAEAIVAARTAPTDAGEGET